MTKAMTEPSSDFNRLLASHILYPTTRELI